MASVVNDANTSLTYKLMNSTFFATHNVDVLEMWWEYAVLWKSAFNYVEWSQIISLPHNDKSNHFAPVNVISSCKFALYYHWFFYTEHEWVVF